MTNRMDGLLAMKRAMRRRKLESALFILLAIAVMLLFLGPLYISITTSLKSRPELAKNVLGLPRQLNWANYQEAMERSKFLRSLLNSCIITFPSVALLVLMASMGGYTVPVCYLVVELSGAATDQEVDAAFVKEQAPDVVVLATGGIRPTSIFESTTGTNVIMPEDVFGAEIGNEVVIAGANAQAFDIAAAITWSMS